MGGEEESTFADYMDYFKEAHRSQARRDERRRIRELVEERIAELEEHEPLPGSFSGNIKELERLRDTITEQGEVVEE